MEKRLLALDLRHESDQPKHERLKKHFVGELLSGRLKPGQAIPTEQQLVETLGVARTTIRQAMASLENDGLIRRTRGKGTFVEDDARRKLRRGQDIFALVVPMTHGGFFPSLLQGCEAAAGEIHHQMLVCNTDDNVDRQASIILQLLDKEVGGVALMPTSQTPTPAFHIHQLQKRGIPVVFCHRRVEGVSVPLLATPYVEVGRLAGRTLVERGHRRIAFLATYRSHVSEAYEKGLQETLRAGGGDRPVESVFVAESIHFREEDVWVALQRLFAQSEPPTAIFASFDSLAEMIYLLLPRLGLRVPEDVSLIGFGGAWREGAIAKRLTSVVLDEIATGMQAVSLLHEMRAGVRPIDDNSEMMLDVSLYEGETVAKPAGIRSYASS
jgi:GntR family transcriptional regulator, arabinose operon transcriptional repressor